MTIGEYQDWYQIWRASRWPKSSFLHLQYRDRPWCKMDLLLRSLLREGVEIPPDHGVTWDRRFHIWIESIWEGATIKIALRASISSNWSSAMASKSWEEHKNFHMWKLNLIEASTHKTALVCIHLQRLGKKNWLWANVCVCVCVVCTPERDSCQHESKNNSCQVLWVHTFLSSKFCSQLRKFQDNMLLNLKFSNMLCYFKCLKKTFVSFICN